ncbi:MAG: ATP-binding protein [Nitrospirales bacterium]
MSRLRVKKLDENPEIELVRLQHEIAVLRDHELQRQKVESELHAAMENLTLHQEELLTQNEQLRQAQDELEESRRQFVDLFEAAPIGYFILDHHGVVTQVNFKGAEILGYSRDYLLGKPLLPYLTHPTRMAFSAHLRSIFGDVTSASAEVDCLNSSGRVVHARVESILIDDAKNNVRRFRTALIDITDRKQAEGALLRTERRLRQTHKMEAIGTLAGGIAHDFNNILMAMIGFTEIVQAQIPPNSPLRQKLNEVLVAGCRARDLVKQILMFSRQTEPEKQSIAMSTVVNEALNLLQATIPSTIHLRANIETETACVFGDQTELHQVLINLCTNAEYAMRETGGLLEINLKEVEVSSEWASQNPPLKPGLNLYLTVTDTGPGMHPQIQERIFDPFFTTKILGEGTGMGLAMVHGIIANHKGIIEIEKTSSQGTVFAIYLPIHIDSYLPILPSNLSVPRKSGRILFVDDEAPLVRMGEELLQQLGYDVVACMSGRDALALVQENPNYFDIVITDQTMPGLTGEDLATHLLAFQPQLPIILITGFSHVMTSEKAKAMGVFAFLLKPLVIGELDHAIQMALSLD